MLFSNRLQKYYKLFERVFEFTIFLIYSLQKHIILKKIKYFFMKTYSFFLIKSYK